MVAGPEPDATCSGRTKLLGVNRIGMVCSTMRATPRKLGTRRTTRRSTLWRASTLSTTEWPVAEDVITMWPSARNARRLSFDWMRGWFLEARQTKSCANRACW